jgi:hypothetical protein
MTAIGCIYATGIRGERLFPATRDTLIEVNFGVIGLLLFNQVGGLRGDTAKLFSIAGVLFILVMVFGPLSRFVLYKQSGPKQGLFASTLRAAVVVTSATLVCIIPDTGVNYDFFHTHESNNPLYWPRLLLSAMVMAEIVVMMGVWALLDVLPAPVKTSSTKEEGQPLVDKQ